MNSFGPKILTWIIILALVLGGGGYLAYRLTGKKSLEVITPNGGETLQAGKKYIISWKAKNIGKVAIVLTKGTEGKEVKWIVKDFPAAKRKYEWTVFTWEEPRQDYKIVIFEYPWKEGNKIDFSDDFFTILGPKFASCDQLSIENEWPFLPSDYPNLKKVFITEESFDGNLGGVEGGDERCQKEAERLKYGGNWKAFLGDDQNLAMKRLNLEGIFIEAKPAGSLPEGKTCHRLLGKNFEEFFTKISDPIFLNERRFSKEFLESFQKGIWLGRINESSKKNCLFVPSLFYGEQLSPLNFSFTVTCQNWASNFRNLPNYPPAKDEKTEFPMCYTPEGKPTEAVGIGGMSLFLEGEKISIGVGRPCSEKQKLLCIEQ